MRILVVGSGGREHALVWALRRSPRTFRIHIAPGNGGTGALATNVAIAADDVTGLASYARRERFDLVVIGPEVPLSLGLSDLLREDGIRVFGPDALAARLESSKAFSKDFMRQLGIPTAEFQVFSERQAALDYLDAHPAPIVVKASGLAAGKGAIICHTDAEAREAIDLIMRQRAFGEAGDMVVIETCLTGQEVSVLAFADGTNVVPMILSQDHKAAYDGDLGPNTGGMGCYAPAPVLDDAMLGRVIDLVLQPVMAGMQRLGTPYTGVLYAGLMVDGDDMQVLEFNCRFGDPEAQSILPLLETDLVTVLEACIDGRLDEVELTWSQGSCACVVMASGGYPGPYQRGHEITGLDQAAGLPDTMVFHAGTRRDGDRVLTDGGRVLGVTAWAGDLRGALDRAYQAVRLIGWLGAAYRRDIGAKGLRADESTAGRG